jgi:hypothetical protein
MEDRIPLTPAARICGDSPGTIRAILSEYLPNVGVKHGKERKVTAWEVAALRVITELSSAKLSLREATQRVAGLLPFLREIVEKSKKGHEMKPVFSIEV